jgi:hypothetical protein
MGIIKVTQGVLTKSYILIDTSYSAGKGIKYLIQDETITKKKYAGIFLKNSQRVL